MDLVNAQPTIVPGYFRLMHDNDLDRQYVYPRLNSDQVAAHLRAEEELIAHGGMKELPRLKWELESLTVDSLSATFNFDIAECDPLAVRREIGEHLGIGDWAEIPDQIPAEHFDMVNAALEENARREFVRDHAMYKFVDEVVRAVQATADSLREAVPAAIERLRPAYPPDLDGAHRPIPLGKLGIDAAGCLDCDWLSQGGGFAMGRWSTIGPHRALHWDPPHESLCYILHDGYQTLTPQRFPDPWEVLEPLLYPPVATHKRRFIGHKSAGGYLLCDDCYARVGPEPQWTIEEQSLEREETPWTWDPDAGVDRWDEPH